MILSIRRIEDEDENTGEIITGYRLANADGRGFGDVVRAVEMTGYGRLPRGRRHPALGTYPTEAEAVAAAESLGRELAERGGAFDIVQGAGE